MRGDGRDYIRKLLVEKKGSIRVLSDLGIVLMELADAAGNRNIPDLYHQYRQAGVHIIQAIDVLGEGSERFMDPPMPSLEGWEHESWPEGRRSRS